MSQTISDAAVTAEAGESSLDLGDLGPPQLRLSFSRVDTYQTCPLKFRYGYVDELPSEPSPHLSWGSSIHSALETWWSAKLPQAPDVDVLMTSLYERWDDTGFADMDRDEKIGWYRHAQEVLRRHHARFADAYQPAIATEQWFEIDVGNAITVVGSIDHLERTAHGGVGVVDWKTNKRAKTRAQVASSLQLAIYAIAARHLWGHEPEWVALDFVVPGVRVAVDRDAIDVDGAIATIHEVAQAIRAESFAPTPNRLCGWCDYRGECPAFDGDGPDVAGAAVVELRTLRRRMARDADRAAHLEALVRERLGDEALVEIDNR